LVLHSHLRMTGAWDVRPVGGRWIRPRSQAWLVVRCEQQEVVQYNGPVLELITAGRARFDQQLTALGPDVLADRFDFPAFLARLRRADAAAPVGDVLLDQSVLAGIGNIWKSEGCWEAQLDPWRPLSELSDAQASAIIDGVRPRMLRSGLEGPRYIEPRVYGRAGMPCPRCGTKVVSRRMGDGNRVTYWCPGCQR
jgi:endonuclease-8